MIQKTLNTECKKTTRTQNWWIWAHTDTRIQIHCLRLFSHPKPAESWIIIPDVSNSKRNRVWCLDDDSWFMMMKNLAGNWLAGWLKKWWWCWLWFSTATHFCRPSFLAVERKKERPQHLFIPSWWSLMMTMILDLGFSFFQFYNIQTTAVYLFLLLFVVSWIVRWFLSSVSCLLMLLIRRMMRLLQNTTMYVCMFVL